MHSFLSDIDPLYPWSHVPPLYERRGQRSPLPEALSGMSTVDRDVDEQGAADVRLSQPDRQRKGQSVYLHGVIRASYISVNFSSLLKLTD